MTQKLIRFKPYPRTKRDSRDAPMGDGYSFVCPRCGFELVHVLDARRGVGPYDDRPTAEIDLECEDGCLTTIIFGNYKGNGYCHYVYSGRISRANEWSADDQMGSETPDLQ